MAEKTLGQVAWSAYNGTLCRDAEESWQAVANAVVAAHEARRWKPIESAPKDGAEIDVWDGFERVPDVRYSKRDQAWISYQCSYGDMEWRVMDPQPIQWTPIPSPPQEADHGK